MKNLRTVLMVTGLGMVMVLAPPLVIAQDVFTDEFTGGIDLDNWRVYSNQSLFTVDDKGGDVFFSKPFGGNGWGHWDFVFLCFEGEVSGDFTASVDFSELNLELTDVGCNAISIENFFSGQVHALVRQECENGGDMAGVWLDPPEVWIGEPEDTSFGTLKVVRDGTTVTSFLDGEEVHSSDDFNADPVTDLCFGLGNNHSLDAVSARFDNFSLNADGIEFSPDQWHKVVAATVTSEGAGYTALDFYPPRSEVAIAYTDPDTEELRVVRGTPDGLGWLWAQPEAAAPEGHAVDLAYDAGGDLWLSYLTGNNRLTAKMAHWDGDDQTWTERQIDRGAKRWVTSLANLEGTSGSPAMTYGADLGSEGQLRFAEGELPPVVVDIGAAGEGGPQYPASGVGSFSSLTYAPDGTPAVAYSYMDQDICRSIKFASRPSDVWIPELVYDCGGHPVREISLAYQDGIPTVVFIGSNTEPLNLCERTGAWECNELHHGPFATPTAMIDGEGTLTIGSHHWGPNFQPELWMFRRLPPPDGWHVKRLPWFSAGDGALDLKDDPAFCFWEGPNLYLAYLDIGGCESPDDCDDANPCTVDSCGESGNCEYVALPDGTTGVCGSATEVCCLGQCTTPWCSLDTDCDDGNECTIDTCFIGGNPPCSSYCEHEPDPSCECIPTHPKEKGPRCTDGIDNDCDGLIDGDDPDC